MLSACVHCQTFVDIIHVRSNNLTWREVCSLIRANAHSIELFTRTQGLDWEVRLSFHKHRWDELVTKELYQFLGEQSRFMEYEVLGISDRDFMIRYDLDGDASHLLEWALSEGPEPAFNPTMTYANKKGESATDRQVNITTAVVAKGYPWINKKQWLNGDPRYRGLDHEACAVCGFVLDTLGETYRYGEEKCKYQKVAEDGDKNKESEDDTGSADVVDNVTEEQEAAKVEANEQCEKRGFTGRDRCGCGQR